jgi:hypothetical protein
MTIDEIKRRVEEIKTIAGDEERAHSLEDGLRNDVLLAISQDKCIDPAECAFEVLKSNEIDFQRWCA